MHPMTCDYKGCDEIAQWYRKWNGELLKLCTVHEAMFSRKHWGRHVDESELNEDDIRYLQGKEQRKELAKCEPFEELLFPLKDGTIKVRVRDRRNDEWRSFILEDADLHRLFENSRDLEKEKHLTELSIDDYMKRLKNGLTIR